MPGRLESGWRRQRLARKRVRRPLPRLSLPRLRSRQMEIYAEALFVVLVLLVLWWLGGRGPRIALADVSAMKMPYQSMFRLKSLAANARVPFPDLLAGYAVDNRFFPARTVIKAEKDYGRGITRLISRYDRGATKRYFDMFRRLLGEIKCFPIPPGYDQDENVSYMYGDSWGAERTYGGERVHQGTDILDRENARGRIPVVSMTDGVVTGKGWNTLGGYAVTVRAESGDFFYYAHLDSLADDLVAGGAVTAGQRLGQMGDSGYGAEGTRGKFPVHLHVGISPKLAGTKDFWINPYVFLRYIEGKR